MLKPFYWVPLATGRGRNVPFGVALVSDVHVAANAFAPLDAVPVKNFHLRAATDCQKCITCARGVSVTKDTAFPLYLKLALDKSLQDALHCAYRRFAHATHPLLEMSSSS